MSRTITISNLKSIKRLEFTLPPQGVYILTGINGSGKTTLMACLERLHTSRAFQNHFRTSKSNKFDSFRESKITYCNDQQIVSYQYSNSRWAPTPKEGSDFLKNFGFDQVIHITSNGDRFYVQENEISQREIQPASDFVKNSMCSLFQTEKFRDLKKLKMSNKKSASIRRSVAYLIPIINTSRLGVSYYSEKNFSLGEILLLNALHSLEDITPDSLVLIDEVELALHPKVQVNFYELLKEISNQKGLTIIISTHSSSLIKSASGKIMFLQRNNESGVVDVISNCFATLPLQSIAFEEDISPDFVFFVEDNNAKYLLEELVNVYFNNNSHRLRPIIRICPIAGWSETILFLKNAKGNLLPNGVNAYAFLDQDVRSNIESLSLNPNRSEKSEEIFQFVRSNSGLIQYLPITPELGIVDLLRNSPNAHIQPLQQFFNGGFDISRIIVQENARGLNYSPNPRNEAKSRIQYYKDEISHSIGKNTDQVFAGLCQYYADYFYRNNQNEFRALFNPIFR